VIDTAIERWGSIDILVNNAGGGAGLTPLDEMAEATWDSIFAVNLKGYYACAHYAIPHMKKKGWGRIVNTGSMVGLVGLPLMTAYAAAKGGVQALTFAMAEELEGTGITVNCTLPSAANPRNERSRKEREQRTGNVVPVNRERVPEAVAPVMLCLVVPEAGDVSGQVFSIAGGQIVHYRWPPGDRTLFQTTKWTVDDLVPRFQRFFGSKLAPPRHPGYPD
jgi:NAD(P)-dependent dehydrogenase (short-subunit alcohol dehydrogenase family)